MYVRILMCFVNTCWNVVNTGNKSVSFASICIYTYTHTYCIHVSICSHMHTHTQTHTHTYSIHISVYRVIPGIKNWQLQTADWNQDVRLDIWVKKLCARQEILLRNTLAGSKTVVWNSRDDPVLSLSHTHRHRHRIYTHICVLSLSNTQTQTQNL